MGYNSRMQIPHIRDLIIYEDGDILIVNKPANLPVLPDGWEPDAPFLLKLLQEKYPDLMVAHRLDKVTSGVMVFALNPEAHRDLNMQFERHTTQKVYHAICMGNPKWDEHTAKHKLRMNVGHSHRTMVDNGKGSPAETAFKVLQGGMFLSAKKEHAPFGADVRIDIQGVHEGIDGVGHSASKKGAVKSKRMRAALGRPLATE